MSAGIAVSTGITVLGTFGWLRVTGITLAHLGDDGTVQDRETLDCDAVLMSGGYTPTVHVGVVSQAAQVLAIAGLDGAPLASLRTADRAVLHCRFAHKPELIREGDTLLFREGRAKGVGRIRSVESPHRLPGAARRPD